MNRFNTNDTHKLGNMFYDTNRQLNINRLVSQNIEHKSIINHDTCSELCFNPYTQYDLHCYMYTNKPDVCICDDVECDVSSNDICEDEHHIHLEHIYNDSLTIHKYDICEERNKMKRDLLKNKEGQKISIKDFLKKV